MLGGGVPAAVGAWRRRPRRRQHSPRFSVKSLLFMAITATPWLGVLCWYDCKYRRLPNVLTLGMLAAALVWRFGYGRMPLFMDGLLGGLAAGLFLLIPFLLRGAGGGDVKMLCAAGCICGLRRIPMLLFCTSAAGFVLAAAMLLVGKVDGSRLKHWVRCVFDWRYDRQAGREALPAKTDERVRLPFGVAIALGLWITLAWESTAYF
ncbi:MAG: prepilin peptidase [Victivallales bacterium]|nr:prepilin peptidase [Victivallales bacterium]